MAIEILTKADLHEFRKSLLEDIREILREKKRANQEMAKIHRSTQIAQHFPRNTPKPSHQRNARLPILKLVALYIMQIKTSINYLNVTKSVTPLLYSNKHSPPLEGCPQGGVVKLQTNNHNQ
jgi:hypothetical protein